MKYRNLSGGLASVVISAVFLPALIAEMPATTNTMSSPGKENAGVGGELSATDIEASIKRAMEFLVGKERSGGPQFSDYVVFCGQAVAAASPEYQNVVDAYKIWITNNDKFIAQLPYQSVCHVMALDMIGQREKAVDIFSSLTPLANEGKWLGIPYHNGWYLYGCLVAGDSEHLEKTFSHISSDAEKSPNRYQYFTAYCLWKAYEKTKEDRYKQAFLTMAGNLKQFEKNHVEMAATDGHMGMTVAVLCQAYDLTKDEKYREIARKLVEILLATQEENGSWNDKTAYTIMPAEGLTSYLKFCR